MMADAYKESRVGLRDGDVVRTWGMGPVLDKVMGESFSEKKANSAGTWSVFALCDYLGEEHFYQREQQMQRLQGWLLHQAQ